MNKFIPLLGRIFLSAGYSKSKIMELIVGVAHKVMSNYLNHIAGTPIDREFEK